MLIDGLDEVSVSARTALRDMLIGGLPCNYRALATSRMVGYEDCALHEFGERDEHKAINTSPTEIVVTPTRVPVVHWGALRWLMPFRDEQIREFATRWYQLRMRSPKEAEERAQWLFGQITRAPGILRLARTPHLLTMMAIVVDNRLQLPDGRALLYREIASAYLGAADNVKNIEVMEVPWAEKQRWLGYVAYRLQMERDDVAEQDMSETSDEGGLLASESRILDWLSEAMGKSSFGGDDLPKRFLEWVTRRSGLLLPRGVRADKSGNSVEQYGFIHLSFQEYFCAAYLLGVVTGPRFRVQQKSQKPKRQMSVPPASGELAACASKRHWHETFVHLFELCAVERNDWVDEVRDALFPIAKREDSDVLYLLARLAVNRHAGFSIESQRTVVERVLDYCVAQSSEKSKTAPVVHLYSSRSIVPLLQASRHTGRVLARLTKARLVHLVLSDSELSDLSPLSGLKSLEFLFLNGTGVSDLSPLSGLQSLQHLNLTGTGVSDLSALSGLKSLQHLDLNGTGVSDLSPLSGLKSLQHLDLNGTGVSDVSALSGIKNLYIDR